MPRQLLQILFIAYIFNYGLNAQDNKNDFTNSSTCSIKQKGQIVFHKRNSSIAYDWFSYIPSKITQQKTEFILITGLHGNIVTDNYEEMISETKDIVINESKRAELNNYIICIPVIPRPRTDYTYTIAFPRKVFSDTADAFFQRPDLKINKMIDKIINDLNEEGYKVSDQVLLYGHSAGAMFVQRYALLHPKRVKALVAGQCGGAITLPIIKNGNLPLNWPAGINDFYDLTKSKFDFESYKKIKQLFYIGESDTSNSTLVRIKELWDSQDQIDFLNSTFGKIDPIRLEKQIEFIVKLGCEATFKNYPNMTHQRTKEVLDDMFCFFEKALEED